MKKTFKQKIANYWDENQIVLRALIFCVVVTGIAGAGYHGISTYRENKAKQESAAKLKAAQQARDTIVNDTTQKQK